MQNPDRSIDNMDVYEALNHVGWELGVAVGMIVPGAEEATVEWDALLKRAVELIEVGHYYEDLAGS